MAKILAVDDEPDIRLLIKVVLEKAGHEVVGAESGEACLENVRSINPDVILLDVMMPGLDGYDVCRALRGDRDTRDIPIVMVTVKSSDEDRIKSLEECADWHIPKPFDKEELVEKVEWVLKYPPRRYMGEER